MRSSLQSGREPTPSITDASSEVGVPAEDTIRTRPRTANGRPERRALDEPVQRLEAVHRVSPHSRRRGYDPLQRSMANLHVYTGQARRATEDETVRKRCPRGGAELPSQVSPRDGEELGSDCRTAGNACGYRRNEGFQSVPEEDCTPDADGYYCIWLCR